jgi:hypothetical protein
MLLKYAHVFHVEETNEIKRTKVVEHQIFVGDAASLRRRPNRTPYALREEIQVQTMLEKAVIRESTSPWAVLAILLPKKSLDGKPKFRFSVDFRTLNISKFVSCR